MNPLERTIWRLELLAACPYCGSDPCDGDCIMQKDADDLTSQELKDRESLELARSALEYGRQIKLDPNAVAGLDPLVRPSESGGET